MLERFFAGLTKAGLKALLLVFVLVAIGASIHWAQNNQEQAQVTSDKVIGAAASGVGWAADGFTSMTGGSAAEAEGVGGPEVVMVESTAPARWHVGGAMRAWNKGLTTVKLKAGKCQPGLKCIKVSQVSYLAPEDGHLVLGRTRTFLGPSVKFNGDAVGQVPASSLVIAACHEFGHALGAEHRAAKSSCMHATIGAGVSPRPDREDFATVNKKFGH